MKKYSILAVVLVLTVTVFTGCGRRRPAETVPPMESILPTVMPTELPTTVPTTEAATERATEATGNTESMPDSTDQTSDSSTPSGENNSRSRMPRFN